MEGSHHCADVGLQQPCADDDQDQTDVEAFGKWSGQAELARGDEDPAIEHGLALSHDAVGNPASGQRGEIDSGCVESIDRWQLFVDYL